MAGAREELERKLEDLGRDLRDVRERVRRLEEERVPGRPAGVRRLEGEGGRTGAAPAAAASPAPAFSAGALTLVGRTLLVLGGAYLVRALADRELISPLAGAAGALLYAAAWIVQAGRSATRGERTSALVHGFTALAIAHPLVWETTLVFELMDVAAATGVLTLLLALGLAVAWRSGLPALAWGTGLAHVVTCFVLMIGTRTFLPPALALLAAAAAVEWAAVRDRWLSLRGPIALGTDLALVMLVSTTLYQMREAADPSAAAAPAAVVVSVLLALPAVFLTGAGVRSLARRRPVSVFEMVQVPVSLLVAFAGALSIRLETGEGPVPLGALAVLGGAGAYAAAFVGAPSGPARAVRSFHAWASLAIALVLGGAPLLLHGQPLRLTAAWSLLALAAVAVGTRFERATVQVHGSIYALAAAAASGLLVAAARGFAGDLRTPPPLPAAAGLTWGVAALCWAMLLTRRAADAPWHALLARALLAALVTGCGVGLVARSLGPPLLDVATARGDAAVAASRSVLIAAATVGVAFAGCRWGLRELRWLVPLALVGGAAKLLMEDLRVADPVALFVGLGAYGGALIAIPRLLRSAPRAVAADPAGATTH